MIDHSQERGGKMKRIVPVVVVIFLAASVAIGAQEGYPWSILAFDDESRAWDATRILLVREGATMTAYFLVRDIISIDINDVVTRISWKGHRQAETAFNGLVQTRGLTTESFIDALLAYDKVPGQLAGLFWASDLTGWETTALKDHDERYRQEIYYRTNNPGSGGVEREEVLFILRGIPIGDQLVHGNFIFLYQGNPDGTVDHVWVHPGWMDERDHRQYWVKDCQDRDSEGEIVNGFWDAEGRFYSINVPCSW